MPTFVANPFAADNAPTSQDDNADADNQIFHDYSILSRRLNIAIADQATAIANTQAAIAAKTNSAIVAVA